ncbi:MAG: MFS transporter [Micromonosporaceae bacterium]|nr:MFS transporter [Micromonosporaceae bacterium]
MVRARVATSLLFLLYGTILGTWTARIPAIKHRLDLSDGQLSIALLAFAAGAITGMQVIGRLVDRYGSTRIMTPAAAVDALLLILPAYAGGLVALGASLLLFGAVHGTLNVAMNANAVQVQQATQRPIMSSFHAVYSIGGFLGAATGGLFAHAGLGPAVTFATVAGLALLLAAWSWRWALAHRPEPAAAEHAGRTPRERTGGVLFLGVLAFCCLVGEGAAADWSSVYLRDSLGSGAGFAATAYAAFAIMMMAGRLAGDRLVARYGPVRLVRACGVLAFAGLGTTLLIGQPIAGVVGFGCLGAGLSCIAPQVFSAAGSRDPALAGRAIARVASLGFTGFLVGPVAIGGAAEVVGLPVALGIPAVLALFVASTATALRPGAIGLTVEPQE